ncbi:hypothetical protein ACFQ1F_01710 [Flaviramulus multivorans]|nr:hypothetical protein [Flaviramulus multivorans]
MFLQKNLAQHLNYNPEIVLGYRSYTYQHKINYNFNDKLKLTNITYYDTEYNNDNNNIYFLRNSLSYGVHKNIGLSLGIGLKNPGSFATISGNFHYKSDSIWLLYSAGITYQNDFTLEQVAFIEYKPLINNEVYGLIKVQSNGNINFKEQERGIQQIRIGIKKKQRQYGLAANFDQFKNNKTLNNYGFFYKHEF